jgi:hypothetical protein
MLQGELVLEHHRLQLGDLRMLARVHGGQAGGRLLGVVREQVWPATDRADDMLEHRLPGRLRVQRLLTVDGLRGDATRVTRISCSAAHAVALSGAILALVTALPSGRPASYDPEIVAPALAIGGLTGMVGGIAMIVVGAERVPVGPDAAASVRPRVVLAPTRAGLAWRF